jgi:hypothetical protein
MKARVPRYVDARQFPAVRRATKKFERMCSESTALKRGNARLRAFWGEPAAGRSAALRVVGISSCVRFIRPKIAADCSRLQLLGWPRELPPASAGRDAGCRGRFVRAIHAVEHWRLRADHDRMRRGFGAPGAGREQIAWGANQRSAGHRQIAVDVARTRYIYSMRRFAFFAKAIEPKIAQSHAGSDWPLSGYFSFNKNSVEPFPARWLAAQFLQVSNE